MNPAAGLSLLDTSPERLAMTSSALCSGWSLVVPGSPEKSFLYEKLTATQPACGDVMPLGTRLPEASTRCVADWITGLAPAGGCERCGGDECVSLASDAANCGACGEVCPGSIACENGRCSCPQNQIFCDGGCVDAASDPTNCGACGAACHAPASCQSGVCTCPQGLTSCGASCVDLGSDSSSCGACGVACQAPEVCANGKCAASCGTLTQCGNNCVDTQTSVLDCGGCGQGCSPGSACRDGQCRCSSGELCDGKCVDTSGDGEHCGGCGKRCGAGESCINGACACSSVGSVSFKSDVAPVLASACTAAGCHGGTKPKEALGLEATVSYSELVGVAASQCGGARQLVVPGDPSQSYLMQKLLGVGVCTGTQMPKAGQALPSAQLDVIRAWICAGAPNN